MARQLISKNKSRDFSLITRLAARVAMTAIAGKGSLPRTWGGTISPRGAGAKQTKIESERKREREITVPRRCFFVGVAKRSRIRSVQRGRL
jgi:hypothetical protein